MEVVIELICTVLVLIIMKRSKDKNIFFVEDASSEGDDCFVKYYFGRPVFNSVERVFFACNINTSIIFSGEQCHLLESNCGDLSSESKGPLVS